MNDLFVADSGPAAFRPDGAQSEHTGATIRQRRNDLAGVINDMAPDIMVLVEGPSRGEELQMFFDADVQGTWQTVLQPSKGGTQNIGLAVRTDLGRFKDRSLQQFDTNEMEAFGAFLADTDDDEISVYS